MSDTPQSPLATPIAWDLVSSGYVEELVPTFTLYSLDALRLTDVREGDRVVDVACGPGTLAFAAAARGASVSALDFSEKMVTALRARASREGVTAVEPRVGDGQALPYADASFDAGFSMFGLIFFPDRGAGMRELFRVLAPGGRVAIASWQPMDEIALYVELFSALGELLPNLPFGSAKAPLGEASEFEAELAAAGFSEIVIHSLVHGSQYASLGAFWDAAEKSLAPLVLLRARLGEEAYGPIAKGVYQRLVAKFGEGPQTLTMHAHLGVAKKA